MLDNTCVITFSCSEVHKKLQDEFHTLYDRFFKYNIPWKFSYLGDFPTEHPDIFKYKKYCGYFLWKPYILLESLKLYERVIYFDTNFRMINPNFTIDYISQYIDKSTLSVPKYSHYMNDQWTKRDTFKLMGLDEERYWLSPQVWTSVIGVDRRAIPLLEEYFEYCKVEDIVTDTPNKLGDNLLEFIDHRWEQSVLSLLVEKYKIDCPSYYSISAMVYKEYPPELVEQKAEELRLDAR